ncbi:hypothetical protein MPSEU_000077000 [Mayamaea pseudoterrestris]|nr:hypothetical protein MPSEU_000077000 [Mayamaea pseudoterrestris]
MRCIRSLLVLQWLLAVAYMTVHANVLDEFGAVQDMDGDGDIDEYDVKSWEQQVLWHSALETVNDLPWWVDEEGETGHDGGRKLSDEEETSFLRELAHNETSRRTRVKRNRLRLNTKITEGFCLPPPRALFTPQGTCRSRKQSCGGSSGNCCSGLECRKGRCKTTCIGPGRECGATTICCSKQCVKCTEGCGDKCGLGIESPKDNIQAFYYPWYSNVDTDGKFRHWAIPGRGQDGGVYDPLNRDLPAHYYPSLGAYSPNSPDTLNQHMEWLKRAGIGTLIMSWWGIKSWEDSLTWKILNAADDHQLKVGFYIEPYGGGYVVNPDSNVTAGTRTPQTAKEDVKYIINTYGCHRAMYRRKGRPVFMFFAARTYDNGNQADWKLAWDELHADARYNPIVIAHDINLKDRIIKGGWDGGHDYGTEAAFKTSAGWKTLSASYALAQKVFYFTASPGFDNTRLSDPDKPIIGRQNGLLYDYLWKRAIELRATTNPVIITSFNEWHEGTHIEPVTATTISAYNYKGQDRSEFTYQDYEGAYSMTGPNASFAYIDATACYAKQYTSMDVPVTACI